MPTQHDLSIINNLITTTIDSANGFGIPGQAAEMRAKVCGQCAKHFADLALQERAPIYFSPTGRSTMRRSWPCRTTIR